MAISRAWAKGLCPGITVRAAISFQSSKTSALAADGVDTSETASTPTNVHNFRPAQLFKVVDLIVDSSVNE